MPPRRACDVCSKRKIQCSIPGPGQPCDWCSHQSVPCTFNREPKKKSTNSALVGSVRGLHRRVEQLEFALAQQQAQVSISRPALPVSDNPGHISNQGSESRISRHHESALDSPIDRSSVLHAPTPKKHRELEMSATQMKILGRNWYFKGMQLLSTRGLEWIASQTDQPSVVESFSFQHFEEAQTTDIPLEQNPELPARTAVEESVEIFFPSKFSAVYPVLDRRVALDTIGKAYDSATEQPDIQTQISAKSFVWALQAVANRFDCGVIDLEDSDQCARRARDFLSKLEETSIAALQAIILLQCLEDFTGQWEQSAQLHSLACRMVCDLGGHFAHQPNSESHPVEDCSQRNYIRKIFWLCYMRDKEISLRSGRPPLLTADYCDVSLPAGIGCMSNLSSDPHLSILKEKACRMLHSPQAFKLPNSHLLWNIRELDNGLEKWRVAVPAWMRPQLTTRSDQVPMAYQASEIQKMQLINLQLDYLYMLINIHTTVRRCGTNQRDESMAEDLHSVVHSSIDLSLEAARSTLKFLMAERSLLEGHAISYIIFYAPTAAMALFLNIVIHPFDSRTRSDLELLKASSRSFDFGPSLTITEETRRFNALRGFVLELKRLADCAIRRSRKIYR